MIILILFIIIFIDVAGLEAAKINMAREVRNCNIYVWFDTYKCKYIQSLNTSFEKDVIPHHTFDFFLIFLQYFHVFNKSKLGNFHIFFF
jgi:hypothetical protein